ncbi:SDR family NAD(P)-dependent oxidoreductase, partial [Frankia sp. CpI1-P]
MERSGHPLLGAAVTLADGDGVVFVGRLTAGAQPWLVDHAVLGTVVLPGTAFVELALHAARRVAESRLDELVLAAPLVLRAEDAVIVQVTVGAADESGRRPVAVHSRPDENTPDAAWVRHASGTVSPPRPTPAAAADAVMDLGGAWPPSGAVPVDLTDVYENLAGRGYGYGPAFRGLRAAWRLGEQLLAEVRLPDGLHAEAGAFGIHPALLDAALHPVVGFASRGGSVDGDAADDQVAGIRLPFVWRGVRLERTGATSLRVLVRPAGDDGADAVTLTVADDSGAVVAQAEALTLRSILPQQLAAATTRRDPLFEIGWKPAWDVAAPAALGERWALVGDGLGDLPGTDAQRWTDLEALLGALEAGTPVPDVIVLPATVTGAAGSDPAGPGGTSAGGPGLGGHGLDGASLDVTTRVLADIQGALADERLARSQLVFVTRNAVVTKADDPAPDLAQAPVWGLVRTAQSEHPDRFVLVDVTDDPASYELLPVALATREPQLAVRDGRGYTPRLARIAPVPDRRGPDAPDAPDAPDRPAVFRPGGTVLVTGGTGLLGTLVARHLVEAHGVRHLLLVSRRGPDADGAAATVEELTAIGAEVTVVAADAADRESMTAVLSGIPQGHPLTAVIHTAGTLADGVVEALDRERLEQVWRPKARAALVLHDLTRDLDLTAFVLFSSVVGILGNGGQGNYAAANTFLDALAEHRRAEGLAATSLAWGLWAPGGGMTAALAGADLARLSRSGLAPIQPGQGLALFDEALESTRAVVVPVRLDTVALRNQAAAGMVPVVLRELAPVSSPSTGARPDQAGSWSDQLRDKPAAEREQAVAHLVNAQVATVLGHATPVTLPADRAFKELGFDSLTAVDLRNRLAAVTGLRLPATLIFDYPTPEAVAAYLDTRLRADGDGTATATGPGTGLAVARAEPRAGDPAEPIAILGIGCRYPGGVRTPEDLWRLVTEGADVIAEFPTDRGWDVD